VEKQLRVSFKTPMRLLTVCRSYRRPKALRTLLQSWDETHSKGSEIIVYLSTDDPKLHNYENVIAGRNVIIDDHRFFGDSINHVTQNIFPKIPYYQGIGDDHVYHTHGWDSLMIGAIEKETAGWGMAASNDLVEKDWYAMRHPSGEVYPWRLAEHLNGMYPPSHSQYGADIYFEILLYSIGLLVFVKDAVIEHNCWAATGKGENDENQKYSYSQEARNSFLSWFRPWRETQMPADKARLKEIVDTERAKRTVETDENSSDNPSA